MREGKAINIPVTTHLLSSILMEDDKLWRAIWDARAHLLHRCREPGVQWCPKKRFNSQTHERNNSYMTLPPTSGLSWIICWVAASKWHWWHVLQLDFYVLTRVEVKGVHSFRGLRVGHLPPVLQNLCPSFSPLHFCLLLLWYVSPRTAVGLDSSAPVG